METQFRGLRIILMVLIFGLLIAGGLYVMFGRH